MGGCKFPHDIGGGCFGREQFESDLLLHDVRQLT
jgi:hypothetical protein